MFDATKRIFVLAGVSMSLAGCAGDAGIGGLFSTGSVPTPVAEAPKQDPACSSLISQIDSLSAEGTIERLEKSAAGKSASVQVQRAAIAKQAELNRANADFRAKCSTAKARPNGSAVAAAPAFSAPPTTDAAIKAAAAAAPAATSGVTVAPSANAKAQQ